MGAGRTGTSLLMQVLEKLGMTVSEKMTPPSEQNQMGGYEDSEVFGIQSDILKKLKTNQLMPLPEQWMDNPEMAAAKKQLETVIVDRVTSAPTIWGVKDPRTALFLPLWIQIFNAHKLVPIYLLAVRGPGPAVRSLKKQYYQGEAISELFWLHKNCAALTHTGGNCFIVHYEDWFVRPTELAEGLIDYTGLNPYVSGNLEEILQSVIKPKLNRSEFDPYQVKNEYVSQLYSTLRNCKDDGYDAHQLMSVVGECNQAMNAFKGWYLEAQKQIGQKDAFRLTNDKLKGNLETARQRVDNLTKQVDNLTKKIKVKDHENSGLTEEIAYTKQNNLELVKQIDVANEHNHDLANQIKKLDALKEQVTAELNAAEKKTGLLKKEVDRWRINSRHWKREHGILKESLSYRMGNILVLAIKYPGWKTVCMPYDIVALLFRYFSNSETEASHRPVPTSAKPTVSKPVKKRSTLKRTPKPKAPAQPPEMTITPLQSTLKQTKAKRQVLVTQYRQASNQIQAFKTDTLQGEEEKDDHTKSSQMAEVMLNASRLLRQLKTVEDEIADLKIRCHYEERQA